MLNDLSATRLIAAYHQKPSSFSWIQTPTQHVKFKVQSIKSVHTCVSEAQELISLIF